ncbi:DivIVA domain-containing protein [Bacillus thuringiensis]|uniref:DivIVA domain-containing protein n=1 Tax=Bacillus thuringiensis TaxID=1428 RepID=UPI0021D69D0C|nr:DivIVA domain-containing protein [Bacillus thuringiensis]MCU7667043.1 DivIVA domain-containing protein [Bacillus thuringiensis]
MQNRLSENIKEKEFKEIKVGLLGATVVYGKQEVEDYLQSLANDVEQLEKDNKIANRKIELLESQQKITSELKGRSAEELQQYEKELVERARQVERMEKSFKRMVLMAEEDAEKTRDGAKKEAKTILTESRKRAEELLDEAKKKLDEAQEESLTIVEEAKDRRVMIDNRYQEIKKELVGIHNFIEKVVISEKGLEKSLFSEKAKQAVVNE